MSDSRKSASVVSKIAGTIFILGAGAALLIGDWRLLAAGFLAAWLVAVLCAPVRKNDSGPERTRPHLDFAEMFRPNPDDRETR